MVWDKMRGYISTNRSKHNLKAHLILVCKYRKELLKGDINYFMLSFRIICLYFAKILSCNSLR